MNIIETMTHNGTEYRFVPPLQIPDNYAITGLASALAADRATKNGQHVDEVARFYEPMYSYLADDAEFTPEQLALSISDATDHNPEVTIVG